MGGISCSQLLRYTPAMLSEARALPEDPCPLREAAEDLVSLVKSQALRIAKLEHQLAGLRRHRIGSGLREPRPTCSAWRTRRSRRRRAKAVPPSDPTATAKGVPKCKPLPAHLPRQETVISPGDACAACGGKLETLGEDVKLCARSVVVTRIVRPRLACPWLRGYLPGALAVARDRAGTPRTRACSPMCWSPSMAITSRSIGKARSQARGDRP